MSKTIHPLGDQSGGVNTFANERDVDDREYATGYNVDSSIPGEIRCLGKWDTFFADANYVEDGVTIASNPMPSWGLEVKGTYTGPVGVVTYQIEQVGNPASTNPDEYKWRKSGVNNTTYGDWSSDIVMSPEPSPSDEGLIFAFGTVNPSNIQGATSVTFTASKSAFGDTKAGYGLFPFQTDFDLNGNSVEGYYLAVHKSTLVAGGTNHNHVVSFYHQPKISNEDVSKDTINIGANHSDATLDYLWIDGAMRIFDASRTLNEHNFAPKKWWLLEKGVGYFKGTSINDKYISTNSWVTETAEPAAPTGGFAFKGTNETRPFLDGNEFANTNVRQTALGLGNEGINVGLYIATADVVQGYAYDDTNIGWGKDATTAQEYKFYYSYIYDNNQESL